MMYFVLNADYLYTLIRGDVWAEALVSYLEIARFNSISSGWME